MEYKIFKDEQPEAGRLVEVYGGHNPIAGFTILSWVSGIPTWQGRGVVGTEDRWRYSSIGEPIGPCPPERAIWMFPTTRSLMIGEHMVTEQPIAVGDSFTAVKIEGGWRYGWNTPEPAIPVSPEQQAAWNNHINPPAGTALETDAMRRSLIEKLSEMADWLKKNNPDMFSEPPASSDSPLKEAAGRGPIIQKWADISQSQQAKIADQAAYIKELEEENERNNQTIGRLIEERSKDWADFGKSVSNTEKALGMIDARNAVLEAKDKKITKLLIENETLKARLPEEA